MFDATIYLSIRRGSDDLTLDGKLYLFSELLTTITKGAQHVAQSDATRQEHDEARLEGAAIASQEACPA